MVYEGAGFWILRQKHRGPPLFAFPPSPALSVNTLSATAIQRKERCTDEKIGLSGLLQR